MSHAYIPRINTGGNFCGHNPKQPRFTIAKPTSERAPLVLRRLAERAKDYYWNPSTLPTLAHQHGRRRRHRSESRESCLLILLSLFKFVDLASLRVGIPTADGFAALSIPVLAAHAGITLRRAERAIAKLKKAGMLTVSAVAERQADGSIRGMAAIKAVSKHLWGCFGLADMLAHERVKAAKRVTKSRRKNQNLTSRAAARGGLFIEQIRGKLPTRQKADPERSRAIALREIEISLAHPDWPMADIQRKARQSAF